MSYRLAYAVVLLITGVALYAVLTVMPDSDSPWVIAAPLVAFVLFPRKWVAERLATKDKSNGKPARWDPPAPEERG